MRCHQKAIKAGSLVHFVSADYTVVLPADIQDRQPARDLLKQTRSRFPFVEHIYADREYSGAKTAAMVRSTGCWKIRIVKRSDTHRFVVLPKRWIVERTIKWISYNRRLA